MRFHMSRSILMGALVWVLAPGTARGQNLDVLIDWYRIMQETQASTATPTVFFTRSYAMTTIAMFDAINSIDRAYQPNVIEVGAAAGASRDAALAQAAHDVLIALYPNRQPQLDASLAATLGQVTSGAAEGTRVGAAVAQAVLAARAHDGWDRPVAPYVLPDLPGFYKATPPQNATVTFTHYPDVQPFIISDRLRSLSAPPPALTSATYTTDFNEVKAIGGATSTVRTAEQTSIAQRWAGVGVSTPFQTVWSNLLRDLARQTNLRPVDLARGYALLGITMHDGLLVTFNGKFLYGLWRPVTAIREADNDGNPQTIGDPTWLPLLPATPPYPSYPGNMTCMAAVSSQTLQRVFGRDNIDFTVTWTGAAGAANIVRSYGGFRELANEQARSRVYGGIHFEFDQTASFGSCIPLADYAFENFMRPRS